MYFLEGGWCFFFSLEGVNTQTHFLGRGAGDTHTQARSFAEI